MWTVATIACFLGYYEIKELCTNRNCIVGGIKNTF